ncbi:MAG TPA: S41 family peptidase [Vicinamibacterales bacterium]|jgi:C-terminal processing protease CtpA/Prc|nr:S41 family peptidase [Vicinamibacterales bacterium]
MAHSRRLVTSALALLLSVSTLHGQNQHAFSGYDRGLSLAMLKQEKQDLRDNYYDPGFRGLDIDKVFAEVEAKVRAATTTAEAITILAEPLLRLNDSHTRFYPPERLTRTRYGWAPQIIGDVPFVTWVDSSSDAARKGLARGDRIINWNRFEPTRATLWQIEYVYRNVRPQQLQRLVVEKPGGAQQVIDVESRVEQRPVGDINQLVRELDDAERTPIGLEKAAGHTLVVSLSEFGDPAVMDRFMKKAREYDSLVLDLRGNHGGALVAVDRLLSYCFEHDVKISVDKMRNRELVDTAHGRKDPFTGRMVVLIDSESASASEITARVLQIEKRATIVGDRSAGAVMASRFFPHTLGGELGGVVSVAFWGTSITVGDVRMSDGKSLETIGVTPDELVLPTAADLAANRDPALARAIALLGGKMTPEQAGAFYR